MNKTYVGIVGSSSPPPEVFALAEQVGRAAGELGATVICGGRSGVMEAAARGCRQAGGVVIGILPGLDYKEGNKYLSFPLRTGLGQARNVLVALNARVVVAVGGGMGTLSEIAVALKHKVPVVALESWPLHELPGTWDLSLFQPVDSVKKCKQMLAQFLKNSK